MPAMSSDCVTECLHSLWQPRRRKPCCILSSRLMVWSRICTADWWIVKWRWMISFDNTLVKRWTILLPPFSLSQMSRIEHFCDFCDFSVTFLGLPVGKKSWRTYPSNAYLWSHRFRMPLSKRPSQAMLSTVIWQWVVVVHSHVLQFRDVFVSLYILIWLVSFFILRFMRFMVVSTRYSY